MNLHALMAARADRPVRVGLIGAGKFGAMFLAQVPFMPGLHVAAIADLRPDGVRARLKAVGWDEARGQAADLDAALATGGTWIGDDAMAMIASEPIEIVIDATGDPASGIAHALACFEHGKHLIMVNVEADALAGPLLAERARQAGVLYSLAYGDQPALICEQVDWARACGMRVVAAGKGTRYRPEFHGSTPDTVWGYYGLTPEQAQAAGMNPKMFNSFLDGTKSGIEMAAVANATGLTPSPGGLKFQPCGVHDIARMLRPAEVGGILHHAGQVEVISSDEFDGRAVVGDLRWGVYVVIEGPSDYAARCFGEYGMITDPTGRYTALWRPYHMIGLELGVSVASIAARGEATGAARQWLGDVVATAKRDLAPGEELDGEGGYTVWGRLYPAERSLAIGGLPIGLADRARLLHPVQAGQPVRWSDVALDAEQPAVALRREMERAYAPQADAAE
ncbi:MAG: NAD(P)H-dependent oxidoreductase [Alphaproteobacteria bacterium]